MTDRPTDRPTDRGRLWNIPKWTLKWKYISKVNYEKTQFFLNTLYLIWTTDIIYVIQNQNKIRMFLIFPFVLVICMCTQFIIMFWLVSALFCKIFPIFSKNLCIFWKEKFVKHLWGNFNKNLNSYFTLEFDKLLQRILRIEKH